MSSLPDPGLAIDLNDVGSAESAPESVKARVRALYELGKPNLSAMVSVSGLLGYQLARPEFHILSAALLALGLWLTSFGACGLNMVVERELDARMRRTRERPIPSGRLGATRAAFAAIVAFAIGFCVLWTTFGWLPAALSVFTAVVYLFVYTPLKSRGPIATWVGAVPGAVPPLMGWAAATARLDAPAFGLFSVLFFWQIPHFFALAWMYRDDYRRGGFDFVPDGADRSIAIQMVLSATCLLFGSASLVLMGSAGYVYGVGALAFGGAYFVATLRMLGAQSPGRARSVFLWSIAYLPLLLVVLFVDGLIR
ncbi:MAG: protoheme IX farnesyltransferase [Deltaproteobacteria bacterium]|nr:protoheme IX farnesyltransferase [Deltaproteobacteria bacterium]